MGYNAATGLVNRKVLETYVASLIQSEDRFVARKALPLIATSGMRAGNVIVHDIDDDGPEDLIRAAGEPFYPRGRGQTVSTVAFNCRDYGAGETVDERDRKDAMGNSAGLLALDQGAIKKAVLRLLVNEDRRLGTLLSTTANWGTNLVGNVNFAYFDGTGGDPLKTFLQAQDLGGRFRANSVIFGSRAVYEATVSNTKLVEGLSTNGFRGLVSQAELDQYLAMKLGMEKAFIMEATGRSTRNPANAARSDVGGNWIWVGYLPGSVDASGARGQISSDASAAVRIQSDAEELTYERVGQIHHFDVSNPSDLIALVPSMGCVLTSVLDPG